MPFIPHSDADVADMLAELDVASIEALYDEIPASVPKADCAALGEGYHEQAIARYMDAQACGADPHKQFVGAGAYHHYVPSIVWEVCRRGEFYTAYTPYQAEASQGSLQVIFDYQTKMGALMEMDVSNASLYDGATSLVEACLMAIRCQKLKKRTLLVPDSLHPHYRDVLTTVLQHQSITLQSISIDQQTGQVDVAQLTQHFSDDVAALVIPCPNFFGMIEDIDTLTDAAHAHNSLVIGVVNPMAMGLIKPPGAWGSKGADIVCGEGQPLGIPLSHGGPYFGFMCTRSQFVRQLPGRIVGRTVDAHGKTGYTLTLQTREQHIRRSKATSNICTNQGLCVVAATVYMTLLGLEGLRRVATASHERAAYLHDALVAMEGVDSVFCGEHFHEFVVRVPNAEAIHAALLSAGFHAGVLLEAYSPAYKDCLLLCATDTKTQDDCDRFVLAVEGVI